jgi:hypothetical protein
MKPATDRVAQIRLMLKETLNTSPKMNIVKVSSNTFKNLRNDNANRMVTTELA